MVLVGQSLVFEHRAVVSAPSREQLDCQAGWARGRQARCRRGSQSARGRWARWSCFQRRAQRIRMSAVVRQSCPCLPQAFDAVADELDRHLQLPLLFRVPMRIAAAPICSARVRGGGGTAFAVLRD